MQKNEAVGHQRSIYAHSELRARNKTAKHHARGLMKSGSDIASADRHAWDSPINSYARNRGCAWRSPGSDKQLTTGGDRQTRPTFWVVPPPPPPDLRRALKSGCDQPCILVLVLVLIQMVVLLTFPFSVSLDIYSSKVGLWLSLSPDVPNT